MNLQEIVKDLKNQIVAIDIHSSRLAKMTGVSVDALWRYRNNVGDPSITTLLKLERGGFISVGENEHELCPRCKCPENVCLHNGERE